MTLPGRPTRFMPQVLVLGRDTCEDTRESRRFLTREHTRDGIEVVHLRDPQLLVEQDESRFVAK